MSAYAVSTACVQGLLLSLLCFGVFISFRIARFADLTCDGSYPLGACVTAVMIMRGYGFAPAIGCAALAGAGAGAVTGLLHTRLGLPAVVSSICVMSGLYSVDLALMGKPLIAFYDCPTIFTGFEALLSASPAGILARYPHETAAIFILGVLALVLGGALVYFLHTYYGLCLQVAGENRRTNALQGVNGKRWTCIALMIANAFIALSGSLYSQFQGFADVNMGLGMVVTGLASVFIGHGLETYFTKTKRLSVWLLFVVVGALIYRFSLAVALSLGISSDFINLIAAVVVVLAIFLPSVQDELRTVFSRENT